jgi:hypothetical protein
MLLQGLRKRNIRGGGQTPTTITIFDFYGGRSTLLQGILLSVV